MKQNPTHLVYIHIGKQLPTHIFDSLYQSLLLCLNTKIYVIVDETLIKTVTSKINQFNLDIYVAHNFKVCVQCIPLQILTLPLQYTQIIKTLPDTTLQFRNAFWVSTTSRILYIRSFMELFQIDNIFHVENDVMLYENLNTIESFLDKSYTYVVKDSPRRVIASIVYFNTVETKGMCDFILQSLQDNPTLNDMDLLGMYANKNNVKVKYFPFEFTNNVSNYIFDGAAIGQFLGGIDPQNVRDNNPTKGFINETCIFKPNTANFFVKLIKFENTSIPISIPYSEKDYDVKQLVNLHIHSKSLFEFSSIFNIQVQDIISGDKILSLCDIIITSQEIYKFHKNIESQLNKVVIVTDFENINFTVLNKYFNEVNKKTVKLFVYTHLLDKFVKYILPNMDKSLQYVLYLHNSDHGLEQHHYNYLSTKKYIKHIYSQNINCTFDSKKITLLPIGIANSMWTHGNIPSLFSTMVTSYTSRKTKGLYVNINPKTYPYRQTVLDDLKSRPNAVDFEIINTPKPYNEYLLELSNYRFCLCVRGNGFSTHREFEALYLGVIPVIINNTHTKMSKHVEYFKQLRLPFFEIKDETLERYNDAFFNDELYKKLIKHNQSSILNSQTLRLSYYDYIG